MCAEKIQDRYRLNLRTGFSLGHRCGDDTLKAYICRHLTCSTLPGGEIHKDTLLPMGSPDIFTRGKKDAASSFLPEFSLAAF